MLRRSVKIQLILFVVITLVGISYVSANYIGLTKYIYNNGCTIHADFDNSGGIFTNAEVTYRGVSVGRVGDLHLVGKRADLPNGGVRVDLLLDDCDSPRIPADSTANITNRSVVGEQYVNLIPPASVSSDPPKIAADALIEANKNTTPTPTVTLLKDLNDFITSVPLGDLQTTVTELYNAFHGRGQDLGSLLDNTNSLLKTANSPDNLNATKALIDDSSTVLDTQLFESNNLASWTHSLNLLSQQLKKSDPDIRRLLDNGPGDLTTVSNFIKDNQTDLGVTLSNLITVGNILETHLDGIEQVFELYPALAAGGKGALQGNKGALALVLQPMMDPQDCGNPASPGQQGYAGVHRTPDQVSPIAPNVGVRCTAPASSGINVRGSANIPGGDPISLSGGGYAYPRVATSNTLKRGMAAGSVQIGPSHPESVAPLADSRYVSLLTDALH